MLLRDRSQRPKFRGVDAGSYHCGCRLCRGGCVNLVGLNTCARGRVERNLQARGLFLPVSMVRVSIVETRFSRSNPQKEPLKVLAPVRLSEGYSHKALKYLTNFCVLHDLADECSAALSAAIFLPFARSSRIALPMPKDTASSTSQRSKKKPLAQGIPDLMRQHHEILPYLMTISTNSWGLRALLSGVFYDPRPSCNTVRCWLGPASRNLDRIDPARRPLSIAAVLGRRQPKLAPLWLGAVIAGIEDSILNTVRAGLFAVDLHSASWTSITHSFIGPSCSVQNSLRNNSVSRCKECLLLFLTDHNGCARAPVCPWKPFGSTPVEYVASSVRPHLSCESHCLRYSS